MAQRTRGKQLAGMAGLREAKWTTAELIEHGFEGQQRQPAVAFKPGTSVLVP